MSSFQRFDSQSYAPSAPSLPDDAYNYTSTPHPPHPSSSSSSSSRPGNNFGYNPTQIHGHHGTPSYAQPGSSFSHGGQPGYPYGQSGGSLYGQTGYSGFPQGTSPDVIRSFELVDRDRSGFIDENELQQALSSGYQRFSLRTIRLLMFLFKNPQDPLRIGPKEFSALWACLGQWRGIFQRYDRDRSGKIDLMELRDALFGLGYAVPASVLQLLISKYDNGSGQRVELDFDSFVECGMIVKGLTEKFKEKDTRYSGSATLNYDEFMCMIIPFLVSY
ncbi:probable calcium-binding protein CML48 [Humulus lupulus]|uniref:probable calcium-binding protein CML48 n=1 Tax=Humulus lupulus TaxID=3486 RepID=UPI002B411BE5|nr:probable calcium-binding protein CML48 [Humulus lupulus]